MIDSILAFFDEHYFLAWCCSWLLWGVIWLALASVEAMSNIAQQLCRSTAVLFRGQPYRKDGTTEMQVWKHTADKVYYSPVHEKDKALFSHCVGGRQSVGEEDYNQCKAVFKEHGVYLKVV